MIVFKNIKAFSVKPYENGFSQRFSIEKERWDYLIDKHNELDELESISELEEDEFIENHLMLAFEESNNLQEFVAQMSCIFYIIGRRSGSEAMACKYKQKEEQLSTMFKKMIKDNLDVRHN